MRKRTVHYDKADEALVNDPACGSASPDSTFTRDRRKTTCENCKNSRAWKGKVK